MDFITQREFEALTKRWMNSGLIEIMANVKTCDSKIQSLKKTIEIAQQFDTASIEAGVVKCQSVLNNVSKCERKALLDLYTKGINVA